MFEPSDGGDHRAGTQRVGKRQRDRDSDGITRFLYDGDQLTAEYNSAGSLLRRYVHGNGDDDPMLWYEGAGLTDRRSLQIVLTLWREDASLSVNVVGCTDTTHVASAANESVALD